MIILMRIILISCWSIIKKNMLKKKFCLLLKSKIFKRKKNLIILLLKKGMLVGIESICRKLEIRKRSKETNIISIWRWWVRELEVLIREILCIEIIINLIFY